MTDPRPSARIRRVLPAPPDDVYAEWIDPQALADFIGPGTTVARVVECDPKVGGRLHIVMSDPDGQVDIHCEYLELDRPNRLRFTWKSDMGAGFESVVTVTLEPYGNDETMMTIEHSPIPPALRDDHQAGWTLIAGQLASHLAAEP